MNAPSLGSARAPRPGGRENLLAQSLQFLKGVGPQRAELLKRLLLENTADLLHFFPVSHKDRASITPCRNVRAGDEVNVRAKIVEVRGERYRGGKEKILAILEDESGELRAGWWSVWVADRLTPGKWGFFSGKVGSWNDRLELGNAEFELCSAEDAKGSTNPNFGRIVPTYSLRPRQRRPDGTEAPEVKLSQPVLRKMVWQVLGTEAPELLADDLPAPVREQRGLMRRAQAVRQMHFPDTLGDLEQARRRLAYEELFLLSTGIALRRSHVERLEPARKLPVTTTIQSRIQARLPFQLTDAQKRAFREVAADLAGEHPMNRLLQGDVGCGKTAVAVATMLAAVAHGAQAALLAPTEVLAEQHHRTLEKLLEGSRVKIGLLRGGSTGAERTAFLKDLASGETHIAIGTHALLEKDVRFKALSVIVVDEQHKFGVEQRSTLRSKGRAPHVLVMTATPIPRSMSLTLYGDLDISIIDALPPGRGEVRTKHVEEAERAKVYDLIRKEAKAGHAAYIVLPRIVGEGLDEIEAHPKTKSKAKKRAPKKLWSEVKGVEAEVKRLKEMLPLLRLGSLHGRMSGDEKDRVLTQLREGQIDILVSTQVIEVGIDLPNATVMVIENAERFGLSSLHQLRGRVGRSGLRSYCLFFGEATTDDGKERLKAFERLKDGFAIAEADFKLRGPGQFFGTAQSGLPEFLVADLIRDQRLLMDARDDAFALVRSDPDLKAPEHASLKRRVERVFAGKSRLVLVDVG